MVAPIPDPADRAAELEAIAAAVRQCTRCALHRTRTQGVPGRGPATARVMAVGEAPGENEDRQGVPFVGAAGSLLTDLLREIGVPPEQLFITNVLKSRPPSNRDPLPEEVEACAPYLDAQIAVIRPVVILLLGRHALQRLLPGAPSISRCHGELLPEHGRHYVPLYHPAAALYNGGLISTLRADFARVRGYLDELTGGTAAPAATPAAGDPSNGPAPGSAAPGPASPDGEQLALF